MNGKELLKQVKAAPWANPKELEVFLYAVPPEAVTTHEVTELIELICHQRLASDLRAHKLRCAAFKQLAAAVRSPELFLPLVRAIKRADPQARAVILPLLPPNNSPADHGELVELLRSPEAELRKAASSVLQQIATPGVLTELEGLAGAKGFPGRAEAADIAGRAGGPRGLALLQAVVTHGSSLERARALRHLGDPSQMQGHAAQALRAIHPALVDDDARVVAQAIEAYAGLCEEPEYFEHLAPFLSAANVELVRAAVRGLRQFSTPSAISALSRKLYSGPSAVRLEVLNALEAIASNEILAPLVEALGHNSAPVRARAGEILSKLGRAGKLDVPRVIIWLLRSTKVQVRRMAVEIARAVPDPNAELWPRLLDYLCDEDWWVRERVKDSVVAMAGTQLTPFMGRYLKHRHKALRRFAVDILAQLKDARALGALVATAREDDDWWTRERAIETIGHLGDQRAVPYIVDLMRRDQEVQLVCLQALVDLGARAAAPQVAELLAGKDVDVRVATLKALDELQAIETAAQVQPLLNDPELVVARKAKEVLLHWNIALAGEDATALQQATSLLDRMLIAMERAGADDLILSAERPPCVKKMGRVTPLAEAAFSAKEVAGLLTPHLTLTQVEELKDLRDVDFSYEVKAAELRFRVNVFQQRDGLGAVFRTIKGELPALEKLGLPPVVAKLGDLRDGLVLVGGPTGSGKSTTLAALIDHINRTSHRHVICLEDPIEFVHASKESLINQRELGTHTATFNTALRSTLRQDPDVILVGEMRDLDTISFALTAADTGHLVFGTVHTASADAAIDRLISAFPPRAQDQMRFTLAESLRAVVCQYLIKRIDDPGRILACEVLLNNDAVANLIRKGKAYQIASVVATASDQGMQAMDTELMRLYRGGVISLEDAQMKAIDKKAFEEARGGTRGEAAAPGEPPRPGPPTAAPAAAAPATPAAGGATARRPAPAAR
ncbi:MAG: PilT/PilU family type 4a pilus ATPase [Proteobacteria bacterium]|nr:PilT/PilU family type 4a pilus ATPase [Pseudomonadota bacterium]